MDTKLDQSLKRFEIAIQKRSKNNVYQLPLWPEHVRGTPNAFLRSALFPAIQGKTRQALKRSVIASQKDITIRYTGFQLDQSDMDVWEQSVHLARQHPLGNVCHFTAYAFLKALGRGTGKSQNEWLKDVFARLEACAVEITHQGKTYAGSLVQEFSREEESGLYRLVLNERLTNLYSAGWTAIPWERRQLLRRKPLAQWLFNYYMSHDAPYPLKVQTLLSLSGSHNSCLRDFKRKLRNALNELQSIGAIDDFDIAHDLVKVRRCR